MTINRSWSQVVDEAIEILSVQPLIISKFMLKRNVDYYKIRVVIDELKERGILETFDKKTDSGRLCTHYKIVKNIHRSGRNET